MSEQMKLVPFSDLITDEGLALINREWIKRRAELSTNPIEYISGVVRDLAAIAIEVKSASLSMPLDDFDLFLPVASEPVPESTAVFDPETGILTVGEDPYERDQWGAVTGVRKTSPEASEVPGSQGSATPDPVASASSRLPTSSS